MFEVHACETIEKRSNKKIKHNNNSKIPVLEKYNDRLKDTKEHYSPINYGGGDNQIDKYGRNQLSMKVDCMINEDLNRAAAVNNASLKSYILDSPIIIMHHLFIGSFGFLVIVVRIVVSYHSYLIYGYI